MQVLDEFAVLGEFYPGSRERRHQATAPAPAVEEDLLGKPRRMTVRGTPMEFFSIGQVARAINRSAVTLRAWEASGILPQSGYVTHGKDSRGDRRWYSRAQAEGIVRLAKETGIMDAGARRPLYDFTDKVWALFRELKGAR